MRSVIGVIAVVIAGCAGQPSTPSPAQNIAVASQAAAAAQPAAAPQPGAPAGGADVQRQSHARKLGLTVVTSNGEVLYCRTERKTGSHVATDTNCLTAQQLDDLHEQTRQDLEQFMKPQLPRPGK
jgi:hypothetical protein